MAAQPDELHPSANVESGRGAGITGCFRIRRALTLAELVISVSIMSILLGGIGSAMLLAGKSIPSSSSVQAADTEAARAIEQMVREATYATAVTSLTGRSITFTVADRNHGVAGPETITYSWSGTAGDPLTRSYNGGSAVSLVRAISGFTLNVATAVGELRSAPSVLLIVSDATTLTADDTARKNLIQAQGWPLAVLPDECSTATFRAAVSSCSVIYISEQIDPAVFADKVANVARGVVTEELGTLQSFGLGSGGYNWPTSSIRVQNNAHAITSGLSTNTAVVTGTQNLTRLTSLGSGASTLADDGATVPVLVVYELNAAQYGGGYAAARRVKLPWGGGVILTFSFSSLTGDAKKILMRSLAWAAAPIEYSRVDFTLQTTAGPVRDGSAALLNHPPVQNP